MEMGKLYETHVVCLIVPRRANQSLQMCKKLLKKGKLCLNCVCVCVLNTTGLCIRVFQSAILFLYLSALSYSFITCVYLTPFSFFFKYFSPSPNFSLKYCTALPALSFPLICTPHPCHPSLCYYISVCVWHPPDHHYGHSDSPAVSAEGTHVAGHLFDGPGAVKIVLTPLAIVD